MLVQEQLADALDVVAPAVRLRVLVDLDLVEERLALAELDEAVGDHDARVAQALDLGADELDAGLDALVDRGSRASPCGWSR